MSMDKEMAGNITRVWRDLMVSKKLQADFVYKRYPKEDLSNEDLKKPEVAAQTKQHGYFDVNRSLPTDQINALEKLVELGYVDKKKDTIHQIDFSYEAHPYVPYVGWQGIVGITSKSTARNQTLTFDTNQYKNFKESAKRFRNQFLAGKHKHITRFEFIEGIQYETTFYEVKDKYFDSIFYYSANENRFIVRLVEPFTHTMNERSRKDWKTLREIPTPEFLPSKSEIDAAIDELEWKKKYIGVIIYENRIYTLVQPHAHTNGKTKDDQLRYLQMPNFLTEDVFSYENLLSHLFEIKVGEFLRHRYSYNSVLTRYKPIYLGGKEIDVFAEKGYRERSLTICECRLRLNNSPISLPEVEDFDEKVPAIREKEASIRQTRFNFWFVTNADSLDVDVKAYAKRKKIEIKRAHLHANWRNMSDWSVSSLSSF